MIKVGFNKITFKAKVYVRENWGSPFIAGFVLLLVIAIVSSAAGLFSIAGTVGVYAYYALVVGVTLQLAGFLKYQKKSNNEVTT